MTKPQELLSVPAAAEIMDLSRVHVWRLCRAGLLGRPVVGGSYVITRRDIERFKTTPRRKPRKKKAKEGATT